MIILHVRRQQYMLIYHFKRGFCNDIVYTSDKMQHNL